MSLQTDRGHCSACIAACPASQVLCAGLGCIDPQTDTRHCGRCGNACPEGQACSAGMCRCPTNLTLCGGACVDVATNTSHCGVCSNSCSGAPNFPNAVGTCGARVCVQTDCLPGFANGNTAPGCETNVNSDPNHYGGCGRACSRTNGTPTCSGGACVAIACNTGFANCDSSVNNGCEVATSSDERNCGACRRVCAMGQTCSRGVCS